jgi:hypothetical protein
MTKAVAIEKRHSKQCDICFLLDTEATKKEKKKFYCYDEGSWYGDRGPKYICGDCRLGLKQIRKMCHQKISNPALDIFKDFQPWFMKEIPLFAKEKK